MKIWGEQITAKNEKKKETYNLLSGWFKALIHSTVNAYAFYELFPLQYLIINSSFYIDNNNRGL